MSPTGHEVPYETRQGGAASAADCHGERCCVAIVSTPLGFSFILCGRRHQNRSYKRGFLVMLPTSILSNSGTYTVVAQHVRRGDESLRRCWPVGGGTGPDRRHAPGRNAPDGNHLHHRGEPSRAPPQQRCSAAAARVGRHLFCFCLCPQLLQWPIRSHDSVDSPNVLPLLPREWGPVYGREVHRPPNKSDK